MGPIGTQRATTFGLQVVYLLLQNLVSRSKVRGTGQQNAPSKSGNSKAPRNLFNLSSFQDALKKENIRNKLFYKFF